MNVRYAFVAERAGHRCEYSRAPEVVFNFPFEIEHIMPHGLNVLDQESNWALACRSCNLHKNDFTQGIDEVTQLVTALFNPRLDEWHINFANDQETFVLKGLTPMGRVTIRVLRINGPSQLAARRQWKLLGIYPE
jgi:hypothetical protein